MAKKIGVEICVDKTKITELINSGNELKELEGLIFEKLGDFKYFGNNFQFFNDWIKKICIRINKVQRAFYTLVNS